MDRKRRLGVFISVAILLLGPPLILCHMVFGQVATTLTPQVQASMDDTRLVKRIVDLALGEVAWTAPDSLVVDDNKKCWLNPYGVLSSQDTKFIVQRQKDGFHIMVEDKDVRWAKTDLKVIIPEPELRAKLLPVRSIKFEALKSGIPKLDTK